MNIKPLNWAEYRDGGGWLAVTPIGTTYAIAAHGVAGRFAIYFNGGTERLALITGEDDAKKFCFDHHKDNLMQCFSEVR